MSGPRHSPQDWGELSPISNVGTSPDDCEFAYLDLMYLFAAMSQIGSLDDESKGISLRSG